MSVVRPAVARPCYPQWSSRTVGDSAVGEGLVAGRHRLAWTGTAGGGQHRYGERSLSLGPMPSRPREELAGPFDGHQRTRRRRCLCLARRQRVRAAQRIRGRGCGATGRLRPGPPANRPDVHPATRSCRVVRVQLSGGSGCRPGRAQGRTTLVTQCLSPTGGGRVLGRLFTARSPCARSWCRNRRRGRRGGRRARRVMVSEQELRTTPPLPRCGARDPARRSAVTRPRRPGPAETGCRPSRRPVGARKRARSRLSHRPAVSLGRLRLLDGVARRRQRRKLPSSCCGLQGRRLRGEDTPGGAGDSRPECASTVPRSRAGGVGMVEVPVWQAAVPLGPT